MSAALPTLEIHGPTGISFVHSPQGFSTVLAAFTMCTAEWHCNASSLKFKHPTGPQQNAGTGVEIPKMCADILYTHPSEMQQGGRQAFSTGPRGMQHVTEPRMPLACGDDERAPYPSLWCHGTVRLQALRRQPIIHVHLACASAMPLAPQLALVVARAGAFPQPLICPKRRFRPCHLRSVDHMPALVQTPCLPVYLRESLQVVKTRLQLSGELRMVGAQQYSGSFQGG